MNDYSTIIPIMLVLAFTTITFTQSGFDKLLDWKGNLSWLKEHFGNTFMSGMVPFMVAVILLLEIIAGLLSLGAILEIVITGELDLAFCALVLAGFTLLLLLFGQRVAKDYAGAFTITGYFIIVLFGLSQITS